jgi:ABC-type transport system involved in multi-copper enzyme maturation permease subunit
MIGRTLNQFTALTQNTLREALSNKVLYGVIVFALLTIAATSVIGALSLHQEERLFNDLIFLASVMFLAGLSIYQGIRSLQTEIKSRTIFTVLAKPVSRTNFLVGRYIGSVVAIIIALLSIMALQALAAAIFGYELTVQHAAAYYGLFLQVAIELAVAILFSSFSSPILSSIFTGAIFVAGSLTPQLREAITYFAEKNVLVKYFAEAAMFVLPDFEKLNLSFELTHSIAIPPDYMLTITGYAIAYIGVVLSVTSLIFRRRDFS